MRQAALAAVLLFVAAPVPACELPGDSASAPWRQVIAKVKYLPETEAMAELQARDRNVVQYVVSLDEPKRLGGRCYWPVDVRVEGRLWKRFLVTPDGKTVIEEKRL